MLVTVVVPGVLVVERRTRMLREAVAVLGEVVEVAGGIGRRGRKMSGDHGVEMIAGGTMMDHPGAFHHLPEEVLHQEEDLLPEETEELGEGEMLLQEDHHQDVEEEEMMGHLEGLHLLEETLGTEMVVVPGDQVLGMILVIVALQEEGEILVKGEDLHQGAWVTDLHLEEDLLPEETLAVMMTGEEEAHHPAVLPLIAMEEECGVEVGTDPLLEEDLLQGVVLLQEGDHHPGVVLLHAVEAEMMDLLIGVEETDLLPVMTHPLPNPDQPVNTKMKAGLQSSVSPRILGILWIVAIFCQAVQFTVRVSARTFHVIIPRASYEPAV